MTRTNLIYFLSSLNSYLRVFLKTTCLLKLFFCCYIYLNPNNYILYIYYLVYFWKNNNNIEVLIDFSLEINTITPTYVLNFDLQV